MQFLIQHGGFFIWFLLLESFIAGSLIIERILYFSIKQKEVSKAIADVCNGKSSFKTPKSKLIALLNQSNLDQKVSLDSLRAAVEIEMLEKERFISSLALIAQSAPLIGLLGTVVGLIRAFAEVQQLKGGALAGELAGGIWEALINTAAGLAVAIPAVIAYNFFNAKVAKIERILRAQLTDFIGKAKANGWKVID